MSADPNRFAERLAHARATGAVLGELLESFRAILTQRAALLLAGRLSARVDPVDAVQQTFLEAHTALPQFGGTSEGEFAAWLNAILQSNVAGLLRDHTRAQKRAVARERSLDAPAGPGSAPLPPARITSPSQRAMRAEDLEQLVRALAALPADQREAVRLRHLEGWPLVAIAEKLGRTPVATAGLIKRGMQALRATLQRAGADREEGAGEPHPDRFQ